MGGVGGGAVGAGKGLGFTLWCGAGLFSILTLPPKTGGGDAGRDVH